MESTTLAGITCVLFDMDGVLVDVSGSYRTAIAETAETFTGKPVGSGTIQSFKNRGGFNDDWELTHAIVLDAGFDVDFGDVVDEFQRRYRGHSWNGLITKERPLFDTSIAHRLASAGLDLGVVTGRPAAEAHWTINHFGWNESFEVVVAREDQRDRPKPDGFPLELALSLFGKRHAPGRTIYIGDTIDDVRAAANAGVVPVGFVPPYLDESAHSDLLRRHGAHVVITGFDTLIDLLGPGHAV